jgi:hypothetical protein
VANPGGFNPRGEDWIGRRLQDLERELRELKAANVFGLTGINPKDGGTDFDGYVNVNGPMSITGALNLPAGIIGNEALANPLKTGSAGFTASNQSFNTTTTDYGTQPITVPAGFTNAVVMNGVSAGAVNSTTAGAYLYVAAGIDGVGGGEMPTYANAGYYASASAFAIRTLTGLTAGATINASVQVRTSSGAWAAASGNVANINAVAIFYR